MNRASENLWVELVGAVIIARIRGLPSDELLRDCQTRLESLIRDTGCKRVMYDALELESPSTDDALTQQALTNSLKDPAIRIAIVVPNTRIAYLSRLAFGDANHRVFYNDMPGALAWLSAE